MVESLLSIDGDVSLSTLVHHKEGVVGPILNHKAYSSILTHLFSDYQHLKNWPILSTKVFENFKLPEADLYLVISQGMAHYLKTPKDSKRINYILNPLPLKMKPSWKKLLYSQFASKDKECIQKLDNVVFSSHCLAHQCEFNKDYQVVPAPFVSRDFPVMGEYEKNKEILLFVDSIDKIKLGKIIEDLGTKWQLKVISSEDQIRKVKNLWPHIECFRGMDNHLLYIELLKARLLIDAREVVYPEKALCALSTGVPTLLLDTEVNREYLTEDVSSYFDSLEQLDKRLASYLNESFTYSGQILRRYALRFNERIFKNKILSIMKSFSS